MTKAKPSKSARKREFLAAQELGERLIDLTTEQLTSIELDDALLTAVVDAKSIRSHSALRRQKQLIGKLMRATDAQPLRQALEHFGQHSRVQKAAFRCAEAWRDRMAGGDETALQAYFAEMGGVDHDLAALIDELRTATSESDRRQLRRRLFRAVHEQLIRGMQNEAD